ncbi:MAG: LuxR C-terminal-related transcriptional regulator, partial [Flavobacteriaceae bacterium]|nr:LuxR C-terminal-related transcriptional regulator [Flavobacteriaceae bacterium]
ERLKKEYKDLTTNDLLVAEMLHDGLSSKDIATELNITPASANTARYRIRKRMGLSTDTDLVEVLRNL